MTGFFTPFEGFYHHQPFTWDSIQQSASAAPLEHYPGAEDKLQAHWNEVGKKLVYKLARVLASTNSPAENFDCLTPAYVQRCTATAATETSRCSNTGDFLRGIGCKAPQDYHDRFCKSLSAELYSIWTNYRKKEYAARTNPAKISKHFIKQIERIGAPSLDDAAIPSKETSQQRLRTVTRAEFAAQRGITLNSPMTVELQMPELVAAPVDDMPKLSSDAVPPIDMFRSRNVTEGFDNLFEGMPELIETDLDDEEIDEAESVQWLREAVGNETILLNPKHTQFVFFAPSDDAVAKFRARLEKRGSISKDINTVLAKRHFASCKEHTLDGTFTTLGGVEVRLDGEGNIAQPRMHGDSGTFPYSATVGGVQIHIIEHDNVLPSASKKC